MVIDKTTGLPEFIAIKNKTIHNIALLFDSEWLCHYPRPAKVVYDNWHQVHRSGIPGITGKLQHKTGPNNREKSQEQQSHQESTPHHGWHVLHHDLLRCRLVWGIAAHLRCCRLGSENYSQPPHQTLTLSPGLQSGHDLLSRRNCPLGKHPSWMPQICSSIQWKREQVPHYKTLPTRGQSTNCTRSRWTAQPA